VSGIGTSPVDIALFACSNVSSSNGTVTFKNSTNPGGAGNYAQPGAVSHETITVVNGASQTAGQTQINGVSASGGAVTFTVHSDGTAGECVVPVVFQQGAAGSPNQNLLPLNTSNQPSVPFGVGGATTFITQAPAGVFGGGGGTTPPGTSAVAATPTGSSFTTVAGTYTYKSSDTYQLFNSTLATPACVTDTYADFQARLSQNDNVGGYYNPTGQSVFCLNDTNPKPPATVTLSKNTSQPTTNTASGANTGGITVNFPTARAADGSVTGYAIFRAQATPPANIGGSYTCPAYTPPAIGASPQTPPPSPWTQIATVADVQAANAAATEPAAGYYYNDTTAVPGSNVAQPDEFCYAVSSTAPNAAGSTQTGTAQVSGNNPFTGAAAQAASTAPTFTQLVQTSTTTAVASYNQPISTTTCDATGSTPPAPPFDFSAYTTANGVNTAQTISQVACSNGPNGQATITFASPLPAGQTLVVTAQKGADGNTVCASGSTSNCQTVGQSVQTSGTTQAAPTITSLSPNTGGVAGGTSVTITGTNLANASSVTFGGVAGTITSNPNSTTVVVTTPAHVAGAVDVVVTTPGGSATNSGGYTYA
jgi:hypothetical protein